MTNCAKRTNKYWIGFDRTVDTNRMRIRRMLVVTGKKNCYFCDLVTYLTVPCMDYILISPFSISMALTARNRIFSPRNTSYSTTVPCVRGWRMWNPIEKYVCVIDALVRFRNLQQSGAKVITTHRDINRYYISTDKYGIKLELLPGKNRRQIKVKRIYMFEYVGAGGGDCCEWCDMYKCRRNLKINSYDFPYEESKNYWKENPIVAFDIGPIVTVLLCTVNVVAAAICLFICSIYGVHQCLCHEHVCCYREHRRTNFCFFFNFSWVVLGTEFHRHIER